MREIFRSPSFVLTIDEERRLLRRARTEQPFASIPEAEAAYEAVLRAMDPYHRPHHVLLADLRLGPPRNDAVFEALVVRLYHRLYGGFRRAAVLVKTQAGRLQLTRLTETNHQNVSVFVDEAAALAYLETASSARSAELGSRSSSRRGS